MGKFKFCHFEPRFLKFLRCFSSFFLDCLIALIELQLRDATAQFVQMLCEFFFNEKAIQPEPIIEWRHLNMIEQHSLTFVLEHLMNMLRYSNSIMAKNGGWFYLVLHGYFGYGILNRFLGFKVEVL